MLRRIAIANAEIANLNLKVTANDIDYVFDRKQKSFNMLTSI